MIIAIIQLGQKELNTNWTLICFTSSIFLSCLILTINYVRIYYRWKSKIDLKKESIFLSIFYFFTLLPPVLYDLFLRNNLKELYNGEKLFPVNLLLWVPQYMVTILLIFLMLLDILILSRMRLPTRYNKFYFIYTSLITLILIFFIFVAGCYFPLIY